MDQGSLHLWTRMNSMLILQLILLGPAAVAGCNRDADKPLILAKIKAHFQDFLGPVPQGERVQRGQRGLNKRHTLDTPVTRSLEEEDISQVIAFPTQEVPCEPLQPDELPEDEGVFTYIFQPSIHILSREVTSAQLWFYTGPVIVQNSPLEEAASNNSFPEILTLSEEGQVPLATMAMAAPEGWTVFHFRRSFFHYLSQNVFVLFIRCLGCPCVADAEKMPFLVATTKPKARDRARRSARENFLATLPLYQHNATPHDNCQRSSISISFEELGWDNWIVHPSSFMFHYCHGNCSGIQTMIGNSQKCCAALPGTMQSLRVRTTSDGGYSFKYEMVPNIITQDCACI
ncbi:inhibin alpha chain [Notechis scutatus]|uniref:Inhibin alpha chain n=1 Tax=Notechis scutatus TaxID=8663 RepID=A0A6J1TSK5_9SAUR|nr:inhibin alpha chain [Notechis scutatus]